MRRPILVRFNVQQTHPSMQNMPLPFFTDGGQYGFKLEEHNAGILVTRDGLTDLYPWSLITRVSYGEFK